jgi:HPt (histidine-containing phosphotransfer) domain-containing protein
MATPATPTSAVPVIDAAQLHRHTGGNANLQVEVLALFVTEVERLMRQVEDAPSPQVRAERLKALTGVARNVGAALLAQEARALETQIASENPDLMPLRNAVAATLAYVRRTGI